MTQAPAHDYLSNIDLAGFQTPKVITCTIEGIVEEGDLARLTSRAPPPAGTTAGDLNRIREKHHSVARLIASGMTQRLVATVTGYTEGYLSVMLNAPGMQELISYYRSGHDAAHQVVVERLRSVAMKSIEKLDERLDSDDVEDSTLLAAAKLGLDRAGHGPRSEIHSVSEHHIFDHNELLRLNRQARREAADDIVQLPRALPSEALLRKDADGQDPQ
jgi:hypothetical protein